MKQENKQPGEQQREVPQEIVEIFSIEVMDRAQVVEGYRPHMIAANNWIRGAKYGYLFAISAVEAGKVSLQLPSQAGKDQENEWDLLETVKIALAYRDFGVLNEYLINNGYQKIAAPASPSNQSSAIHTGVERHPEDYCHICGNDNPTWHCDNDLFNRVNGSPDGIMCQTCFSKMAKGKGIEISVEVIAGAKWQSSGEAVDVLKLIRFVKDLGYMNATKAQWEFKPEDILQSFKGQKSKS